MISILKEIPGCTGYFVSNDGNVYSALPKGCRDKYNRDKWCTPKKLNKRLTPTGYARVYLRDDKTNKRKDYYVHRLVAEAFIPNIHNLPEVNHIDSNPSNNSADNLEWIDHYGNLEYAFTYGNKTRDNLGRFAHK